MLKQFSMITTEQLGQSMSYEKYLNLLQDLMAQGKTTGPNQDEFYVNYAKLNLQRMLRLDKTVVLNAELKAVLKKVKIKYTWLVLTEGWCGDAAQNIPVMAAIEKGCSNIFLQLLLRDENLELMDHYLTKGSRSIPKLICLEKESLKEIFTWGPRPSEVQEIMIDLKKKETPLAEKSLLIQKWYNADKTLTMQKEIIGLVKKFMAN